MNETETWELWLKFSAWGWSIFRLYRTPQSPFGKVKSVRFVAIKGSH